MPAPPELATFPACRHGRRRATATGILRWLAEEPFRVFFASGMVWGIVGVSLWPFFYFGRLGFFPGQVHARLMIEAFGGGFVAGFLGTAGPRMATAPKLTPAELIALFALHSAGAILHLALHPRAGDACFLALLVALLLCLVVRVARFRKDWPPPQMLLAATGLLCGISGAWCWLQPATLAQAPRARLAALLLYQGLLLPPVLGIGSFLFPRILGGDFGEPATSVERRRSLLRAAGTALLLVASFFLEALGSATLGRALRAASALGYLWVEVSWRGRAGAPPRGTLAKGLFVALGLGLAGIALPAFAPARSVPLEHLLYAGGFGLLIMIVGSRVLFGHGGTLEDFARPSWIARLLVSFVTLAAATRAVADFLPSTQVTHLLWAAWVWIAAAILWLVWHRRRFINRAD